MKMQDKYHCGQCEKSFKYEDVKRKHILNTHENAKFYCHFYNNKKTCPYDDECVFLHEDSKICKYGKTCEINYCMFKHKCIDDDIFDNGEPDEFGDVEEEIENDEGEVRDSINGTFKNLSREDTCKKLFDCRFCDCQQK